MLTVHRNVSAARAKELYETFRKFLSERMPIAALAGIGDDAHGGATGSGAPRAEVAVVSVSGDFIVSISLYSAGRPADAALVRPLSELAKAAIANKSRSSESFGRCEWLETADAEGFLDAETLTVQRTGSQSCLMFDGSSNTLMVALAEVPRETLMNMMAHNSGCQHVPLPEFGAEAFGEHSCSRGNTHAASIHVWKNGREAWIVFAPTHAHPESGSVGRLKAVAARVIAKM